MERIRETVERARHGRIHGAEKSVERRKGEVLQDRGALPKEEADIATEYTAMHEEKFLSSWLREDVEGIEERRKDREEKVREKEGRSGKERREKRRKRLLLKRRCVDPFSSDVVEEVCPTDECDSVGDSCGFLLCLRVCLM